MINTVWTVLSVFVAIGNKLFGEHPLVARLLKGISNLKPGISKYEAVWDPVLLLNHMKEWGPTHQRG